jgi:hypothetical protein
MESFDGAGIDTRGRVESLTAELLTRMPDKFSEHVKLGKPGRDGKILAIAKSHTHHWPSPNQPGQRLEGLNHYSHRQGYAWSMLEPNK